MRAFWPIAGGLLILMGAVQVVTALGESQTFDEGMHIASGYAYVKLGDYRWNVEHPPLVKIMSALPLLALNPVLPVKEEPWRKIDQVQVGGDFLYRNRVPADPMIFRARAMTIVLTLLGGLALALWTRRRFGALAALIALAFYALDPNLIAHGRYVTTDVPLAVFFFVTCATWAEYLMSGRDRDLAASALSFAVAMVVKFSAVLLVPPMLALYLFRWWQRPEEFSGRRFAKVGVVLPVVCIAVVMAVYWPETVRCLRGGVPALAASVDRRPLAGKVLYRAGRLLHLPNHAYLAGLNAVASHNNSGHDSYLLGMHSKTGWWYYFPVVFAVKSTMAALLATALLIGLGIRRLMLPRDWYFPAAAMILPAILFFVESMTSAINIGVRHILPVYPLLYVAAGALLASWNWSRAARVAALALVGLQAVECASIYPDYLAFFNYASGGPAKGPHYLVDSNIDWGQDLKKLVAWLDQHASRKVWLLYFGKAEPTYYGLDPLAFPLPNETKEWDEVDGFAAVSVTPLQGVYVPYENLARVRGRPVVAKIGHSIYVFDLRKHAGTR